ncbi:MAG: hypothetical protein WCI78_06845 [Mycobacterium sp.]|jgi:hypothetical protein
MSNDQFGLFRAFPSARAAHAAAAAAKHAAATDASVDRGHS